MTPIEIMALLLAGLGLIKMIVIFNNPAKWHTVVKKVYANPQMLTLSGVVIAGGSLYYLLQVMTIVEIFAVMFFMMGLMMMSMAAFTKDVLTMADKIYKRQNVLSKAWLAVLAWIALCLWVLLELFM